MSNVSVPKSVVESIVAGTLDHSAMVTALKAALNPTRTFVSINGRKQEIPNLKGIKWFPYTQLVSMGLKNTYKAVSNGRWLPISETGTVISGFSWRGSVKPVLIHETS